MIVVAQTQHSVWNQIPRIYTGTYLTLSGPGLFYQPQPVGEEEELSPLPPI